MAYRWMTKRLIPWQKAQSPSGLSVAGWASQSSPGMAVNASAGTIRLP
jgi:hypothetical protein